MMGTSVCKQCVRYKDNCFQSSSSENGNIYIRKTTNDKKYCDTKPRSSSISANATYSSTFNKTAGFWNSWESINTIRSKSEKDRSSDLSRIKSVGKMFDTKLPYKSSPRIERECITDNTLIENGGTDSRYQEGRQLKNHPSSNSFRDLQTCSNESENARIDLYRRNVMGNYETNGIYTEIEQSEDSSRSSSSSGSTSSSNKSENGHLQVYQEYFVDAVPSTSASHGNRTKNTVNGNGFMKSSKIPAEEKLDLHESDVETSLVTHMENIVPIVAGSGDIESSINSGNDRAEREKQFSTKVQSVCKGAVPRTSPTSPSRMQEDRQKPKYLYEVKGAGLDLKNMTAEVSVNRNINYSTRRDNGDNVYKCCLHVTPPPKKLDTNEGRLNTYKNWPNNNIDPKKLAAAGFFYSGKTDIVECFICGIKGHNWLKNDDPMEDHRKWNRNCPFVRENTPQTLKGSDYCGNLGVTHTETEEPAAYYRNLGVNISPHLQNNANTTESETSESHNLEGLLLRTRKGPSHPDQIIFESRLATFVNWPKSMKQKPAELAAAGFYYLGIGDQTLCFYCGGGLKDWVEDDDPWEQHALWFPKCNYVLLKKTPAFVKSVQDQHKSNSSSKQHETEEEPSCSSTSENHEESSSAAVEERERNNKEESSTLCKICYKNELAVVFLPCGHMVACVDCASGLKECAICRKEIQANVRAFLS